MENERHEKRPQQRVEGIFCGSRSQSCQVFFCHVSLFSCVVFCRLTICHMSSFSLPSIVHKRPVDSVNSNEHVQPRCTIPSQFITPLLNGIIVSGKYQTTPSPRKLHSSYCLSSPSSSWIFRAPFSLALAVPSRLILSVRLGDEQPLLSPYFCGALRTSRHLVQR